MPVNEHDRILPALVLLSCFNVLEIVCVIVERDSEECLVVEDVQQVSLSEPRQPGCQAFSGTSAFEH